MNRLTHPRELILVWNNYPGSPTALRACARTGLTGVGAATGTYCVGLVVIWVEPKGAGSKVLRTLSVASASRGILRCPAGLATALYVVRWLSVKTRLFGDSATIEVDLTSTEYEERFLAMCREAGMRLGETPLEPAEEQALQEVTPRLRYRSGLRDMFGWALENYSPPSTDEIRRKLLDGDWYPEVPPASRPSEPPPSPGSTTVSAGGRRPLSTRR